MERSTGWTAKALTSAALGWSSDEGWSSEAAALMARVASGDEEAFRELVNRYQRRVYRLSLHYLRHHEDALDVVQETFVRVYRARTRFRSGLEPEGWILRIATNLCIDQHRRRRRSTEEPFPEPAAGFQPAADGSSDPLGLAIAAERERALVRALDSLAPRQRMVFVLRHYQHLSLLDIAMTLRCSVGTVKSSLHRALTKLRTSLERDGHV